MAYTIVVDNASLRDIRKTIEERAEWTIELIQLPENLGIAEAQNIGIERAMNLEADFVLLSDQDSLPSTRMVSELLRELTAAQSTPASLPVAAIGPATIDGRTGNTSFFVTERAGFPCRWRPPASIEHVPSHIEVSFLIASGMLIPIEVLQHIGNMRSNYFIDHVDTEWCFRAKAAGYRLLGVPTAKLTHQMGDFTKKIWFFGYRHVMYHTPLRDYYMFRNTMLMLRNTPMSWPWRFYFSWRLIQFATYFLIATGDRHIRLYKMTLGLLHGLKNLSGRLETGG